MPVDVFLQSTAKVQRVPATAVYLTSHSEGIAPALLHNLKANLVRHERIVLLMSETMLRPTMPEDRRAEVTDLGDGLTRVVARWGFTERPDLPAVLADLAKDDPALDPKRAAFFLSRQTLLPSTKPGMALWREKLFAAMSRNAETPMTFFRLPPHRMVELGSQVEI